MRFAFLVHVHSVLEISESRLVMLIHEHIPRTNVSMDPTTTLKKMYGWQYSVSLGRKGENYDRLTVADGAHRVANLL